MLENLTKARVTRFRGTSPSRADNGPANDENSRPPLLILVRADSKFATKPIINSFREAATQTTANTNIPPEQFSANVRGAYKAWAAEVAAAKLDHLDYEGVYGIPKSSLSKTDLHIHTPDELAKRVLHKACDFLKEHYPEKENALFVSLDDMIHGGVFNASKAEGFFSEIGFSRIFSHQGDKKGYVGRPGHADIDTQIARLRARVNTMHANGVHRVPIILLEDNVRHAETMTWIFNRMEQGGVFEHGKLVAVATCFSVASEAEKAKIVHEDRQIPLIVEADYSNRAQHIDVETIRDHMFDGFVIEARGSLGRMPSFLLTDEKTIKNFKIAADQVGVFKERVLNSNLRFCDNVVKKTGVDLPIGWFASGSGISEITGAPLETPMREVLRSVAAGSPSLHA